MEGEMPPTSFTPVRVRSQAPALIHSARVWNLPSAVSGPITGMSRLAASQA